MYSILGKICELMSTRNNKKNNFKLINQTLLQSKLNEPVIVFLNVK